MLPSSHRHSPRPRLPAGPVQLNRHVTADSADMVGSKAARLASLRETINTIPPWYVITAATFEHALREAGLQEQLGELMQYETADARWFRAARDVHQRILDISFPQELRQALVAAHDDLLSPNAWVAVRASACPPMKSGLCKSYLYVRRRTEIDAFIRRVWASAFSPEAVSWRRRHHLPPARPHVAVIVQQMVRATASGVIYTAHPESGDPRNILIRSLFGNGKAIGDPAYPADQFRVDKQEHQVQSTIVVKPRQLTLDEATGGLHDEPIDKLKQWNSSLRADDVSNLARLGSLIENHFGRPQAISFAVDAQDALSILEVVDMGDVREYGPAAGNPCQWDIAELFIDRTGRQTPLQFSVFRRLNELAATSFASAVGVSPEQIDRHRRTLADMRGRVHGCLFANLDVCRRFLQLCASSQVNTESVAAILGLDLLPAMELPEPDESEATAGVDLWTVMRTPLQLAAITADATAFHREIRAHLNRWRELSLPLLPPSRLLTMYYEVEDKVLGAWSASWANDYHAACGTRHVELMVRETKAIPEGSTHWHLLLDEAPGAPIHPALDLMALADIFRSAPHLRAILTDTPPHQWFDAMAGDPACQTGLQATRAWLKLHGHLPTAGYGPGGVPWRRHPSGLARLLREYVKRMDNQQLDPIFIQANRLRRRDAATEAFADSLGGAWLTRPRAALQRTYVEHVREAITCRWEGWMLLGEVWDFLRDLLDALGNCLAREALLPSEASVTYLTLEEVKALFNGSAATTDLQGLIDLRRREANTIEHTPPPTDRAFYTYGIVHHRNRIAGPDERPPPEIYEGVGCEPGIVRGQVRWMSSPLDAPPAPGQILAAEAIDPGWAPVLPLAAGILVQRGHPYSVAAGMARELGIPAIVNIRGLDRADIHGWQVTMDASAGRVSRDEAPPGTSDDSDA